MKKIWEDIITNTPIEHIESYGNADIYIMRDDKISYSYGGNKVRMAIELFTDLDKEVSQRYESIITYGSEDSNLNRVISEMAYDSGIPCYILTSITGDAKKSNCSNSRLVDLKNPVRIYCDKAHVKENIEKLMLKSKLDGFNPYYVYGDSSGHGHEEVLKRAYSKAYTQISSYESEKKIHFDNIYVACGTGSTMQGLVFGRDEHIKNQNGANCPSICGISIARRHSVDDSIKPNLSCCDRIIDDYIAGGYGEMNDDISTVIKQIYKIHSIALDPIYTGKAYYGMRQDIVKSQIKGNILFIHTGGYPIFCDYMGIRI